MRTPCPSCGAELAFRTSYSVYAVCAYCGSTVVRRDQDVERIGTAADLPDEMTPLQVGTECTWQGSAWTLVGRARIGWSDGAWNEWYLAGPTPEQTAWLAEAQGFLAISQPTPIDQARGLRPLGLPALDDIIAIGHRSFRVADIKQATCLGAEGELPFAAPKGRTATYLDMLDVDAAAGFASIEDAGGERSLYVGHYIPFDRLAFRNLREVEGWARPPATVAA